ncbi:MAG: hypothetical protein ABI172_08855 [Ginsengibacter sp.]
MLAHRQILLSLAPLSENISFKNAIDRLLPRRQQLQDVNKQVAQTGFCRAIAG